MKTQGFSILEIVVVVAILAIVAASSLLALSRALRKSPRDAVFLRLLELDRYARNHSKRSTAELQIDLITGTLSMDGQVQFRLPEAVRIVEFLSTSGQPGPTRFTFAYHDTQCATYAYRVAPAVGGNFWLVIAGPSGEYQRPKSDDSTDAQLKSWFAKWHHAD